MKKSLSLFIAIGTIFLLGVALHVPNFHHSVCQETAAPLIPFPKYIAHAGGGVRGLTYTNSREALDANYRRGHRFFEIDLDWTSDNHLVLIHDWDTHFPKIFQQRKNVGVPSLDGFLQLRMKNNLTPMSFAGVVLWLRAHHDARIVTDIKNDNLRALKTMAEKYPDLIDRIIPQIYAFEEYKPVRDMGYRHIILTLYAKNYPDGPILDFAQNQRPLAITMWAARALGPLPPQLTRLKIPTFAHTINSSKEQRELEANGVAGFYTDFLYHKGTEEVVRKRH